MEILGIAVMVAAAATIGYVVGARMERHWWTARTRGPWPHA